MASIGKFSWVAVPAVIIGSAILTPWTRNSCILRVSDAGVSVTKGRQSVEIPWTNVKLVKEGPFPSLVFKEPQIVGRRPAKRFMFDGFDPRWRTRATTKAILREFEGSRNIETDLD